MQVAVLGLNVGANVAALLAGAGHRTVGIDINTTAALRPRYDVSLDNWMEIRGHLVRHNLTTSTNYSDIKNCQYIFVCVNTDMKDDNLNTDHVSAALKTAKMHASPSAVAVILSTLPYGGLKKIISSSGWPRNKIIYVPLMIAAGEFFETFRKPALVCIGAYPDAFAHAVVIKEFYNQWIKNMDGIVPAMDITLPEEAELAKLFSNAYTSVKMSMANMFGLLCERAGLDGVKVMNIVASNPTIGYKFFKPGYAFSGNCFPRDLEALITTMHDKDIRPGILTEAGMYNKNRAYQPLTLVKGWHKRRVLILGLSYKSGVSDIRSSAAYDLYMEMIESGIKVEGFDPRIVEFERKPKDMKVFDTVIVTSKEQEFASLFMQLADNVTIIDYTDSVVPQNRQGWQVWHAGRGWVTSTS